MEKIIKTIVIALLGIGVIVVAYLLTTQYIRNQAIDKCLAAGKAQFVRNGQTLTGPDGFWYNFCMKEKGLK